MSETTTDNNDMTFERLRATAWEDLPWMLSNRFGTARWHITRRKYEWGTEGLCGARVLRDLVPRDPPEGGVCCQLCSKIARNAKAANPPPAIQKAVAEEREDEIEGVLKAASAKLQLAGFAHNAPGYETALHEEIDRMLAERGIRLATWLAVELGVTDAREFLAARRASWLAVSKEG